MATKVLSLRLPEEIAMEIAAVARANGVSVSRAIRFAIEDYVVAQRADKAFKARLKKRLEEDRELLERLAD
ncbi:MAG TPA: ribbon-helix-helix protein, CopG family [Solirubrobacterales bacterium]|nr:ribbon-helix-helix protein, CopG family [Solirubrobacterales bacterium]